MSTTAPTAEAGAGATDVQTFRGRTLEEVLPQIRSELGPDAVVVRQRDGLVGGIGGFFQQRFVEVDARAGTPRIDVYDEEPEPAAQPDAFAALLAEAESAEGALRISASHGCTDPHCSADLAAEPAPFDAEPAAPEPSLTHELTQAGMSHAFAVRLVADAEAHELPFADGDLRAAVRRAIACRVPTPMPHRAGSLAVAFAGPGSTACASALAAAYKRAGRDARALATLEQARARVERGGPDQLIALDLPPIAAERGEVAALAERVAAIGLDELLIVLDAELDLPSARALHERLAPLEPTGLALACEPAARLGAALEL
ncbi:MAG TPA: hypothetical protein VFU94_05030, partial [Conexibacter sp.]|nr:hypothetical protein [Conexibacter sp.]